MNKRKQEAFNNHRELIYVLFYLGKGLMFRKHLIIFFELLGYRKKDINEAITDLISADLLEVIRITNSHLLKLKKYGIYTLQNKNATEVSSIRITTTKILRSAFLTERFLSLIATQTNLLDSDNAESIYYFLNSNSTYIALERENYVILDYLRYKEILNPSISITEEINHLYYIHKYSTASQEEKKELEFKMQYYNSRQARLPIKFNLNSLPSRDIYLYLQRKTNGVYIVNIDFLDLYSNITKSNLIEKLFLSFQYLRFLVSKGVDIKANVIVLSKDRMHFFKSHLKHIKQKFINISGIEDIDIEVINLNLDKKFFGGTPITR